ncbi:NAD(P)H-dependent oxidoreductase [Geomicrobium sp. JCM 19037]|uniref:NAD(P)H-dependent oxidoreductase n=1 Tax=Geomicrobium sp. JCM 19037 TaxID=1460634 RepID=UPI000693982C|nr:NAD(P)H-dependent oxidoreductase [Geomicrobium sp. JCM 19037]
MATNGRGKSVDPTSTVGLWLQHQMKKDGFDLMRIRLIVAHPRKEALTMKVAERFVNGAEEKGHIVDVVDLYREEFNPVLFEKDEPDFESKNNVYTETVMKEVKHIEESDALVFIFPIWWYGMPAIMKGYVDRVINYGVHMAKEKTASLIRYDLLV